MKISVSDDIKYIGVDDMDIDLFEGQYEVADGMAYSSYVIVDDKVAVLDTVDAGFVDEWLCNLEKELKGRAPAYLVVHHMESDHSAGIKVFAEKYPEAAIVSSAPAFNMMKNFFGCDFAERRVVVKEGSVLELGKHKLTFIGAPMVHWPEVLMSYDDADKVLFSADGFGKFGANKSKSSGKNSDGKDGTDPADWDYDARTYYFGIVGKFGVNVQSVLKKAAALDIQKICPLHGPVLSHDLGHYIGLYDKWSSYTPESKGVVIAFTSVYGHTAKAAFELKALLEERCCNDIVLYDLARDDLTDVVADAFRYDRIVLATTTYNGDIFPYMKDFINRLVERNFQKRTVALIENGSWAPMAAKVMTKMLEGCKELNLLESVTIRGGVNDEVAAKLGELADKLCAE